MPSFFTLSRILSGWGFLSIVTCLGKSLKASLTNQLMRIITWPVAAAFNVSRGTRLLRGTWVGFSWTVWKTRTVRFCTWSGGSTAHWTLSCSFSLCGHCNTIRSVVQSSMVLLKTTGGRIDERFHFHQAFQPRFDVPSLWAFKQSQLLIRQSLQ